MNFTWRKAAQMLTGQPAGARLRFPRHLMPHPLDEQFRVGVGLPVGQRSDFFRALSDGRGLHVQDFGTHYEAHLDRTPSACDDLARTVSGNEALSVMVAMTALGGLVGLLLGKSKESTVVGALVGAAIGGATAMSIDGSTPTAAGSAPSASGKPS